MDDKKREHIYKNGYGLYKKLKQEIDENPRLHFNKKYRVLVTSLHAELERAQELYDKHKTVLMKRSKNAFLSKLPINIPVPADELDISLGKCAITMSQLQNCQQCKCLHCEHDNCKGSCFVCPQESFVQYCEDICIRRCKSWNINIQNTAYTVDYLAYVFRTDRFYIFIHSKSDTTLKPMIYNNKTLTVRYPQEENVDEIRNIAVIIQQLQ